MNRSNFANTARLALLGLGVLALPARADDQAKPPPSWWDSFTWSGYVDGGITGNPDDPNNGINFGNLYSDRANFPVLNQASVILTRPLDPKAVGVDFGFIFQPMYGTDARFTHYWNEFDRVINSRYQFDIVQAAGLVHLPIIASGGMDVTLGQYITPIGYEVINPTGNPLYSHSYIYNFSIPIKHTGIQTVTHLSPMVDFYLGTDMGNLSWFGPKGDNNSSPFHVLTGLGFNLFDGNVTLLALTHIGAENPGMPVGAFPNTDATNRYYNDIVLTIKYNEDLTLTTELNYTKDDTIVPGAFNHPDAYGIAQYASYTLNDMFTLQGRAEVWRDSQGFFAAAFPANFDFTNVGRGLTNTAFNGGRATYEEVTLGVNVTPPGVPDMFKGLKLRPEVRYDLAQQAHPFNDLTSNHQVTIAADLIVPF